MSDVGEQVATAEETPNDSPIDVPVEPYSPTNGFAIPAPEDCRWPAAHGGTPTVLGDNRTWHLAEFVPTLAPVWDRLYDDNVIRGEYHYRDIYLAASHLLFAHYEVRQEAAAWLIQRTDPNALQAAVEKALCGDQKTHRTWSDWVRVSLYMNGIDPASIPPADLRLVLEALEMSDRTVAREKFISADEYRARRARSESMTDPW